MPGRTLASAWVSIGPDLTGFSEKARAKITEAMRAAGDKRDVKLSVQLDTLRANAAIAAMRYQLDVLQTKAAGMKAGLKLDKFNAQILELRARLDEATRDRTMTVRVDADTNRVRRALDKLPGLAETAGEKAGRGLAKGLGKVPWWLPLTPAALPLAGVLGGAGLGLGAAGIAGAGALGAFGAVAKPVLSDALKAAQAVNAAQNTYEATIKTGVPVAQARAALTAANAKAQLTYAAALDAGTKPAKALAAYQLALARNQATYNAATNAGTFNAKAYRAEQLAINKAYIEMSPQQIALSQQLGKMADAWQNLKQQETPVVAGALTPWLATVTDLTKHLAPVIEAVSPMLAALGRDMDNLVNSPAFAKFTAWVAGTGTTVAGAAGTFLIDFIKAAVTLLPQFTPLVNDAAGGLTSMGQSLVTWASSKSTADHIRSFMAWFKTNGPTVKQLLSDLGTIIGKLFPGLGTAGQAELNVIAWFTDKIAKLPAGFAKPLTEAAAALLVLAKLPGGGKVISLGIKLVGKEASWMLQALGIGGKAATVDIAAAGMQTAADTMVTAAGAMQAAADTMLGRPPVPGGGLPVPVPPGEPQPKGSWLSRIKGKIPLLLGRAGLVAAGVSLADWGLSQIPNKGTTGIPGMGGNWLETPFGMPGPKSAQSANNWLTSWAPYERFITKDVPGWFDTARHQVSVTFDGLRHDSAHWWDMIFQNTIGRVRRGWDDVTSAFDGARHHVSSVFDGIRHDTAHWWDMTFQNTIGRVHKGWSDTVRGFDIGRHDVADVFDGIRHDFATWGDDVAAFFTKTIPGWWDTAVGFATTRFADPVKNVFKGAWDWVTRNVWTPVQTFFTKTLGGWVDTGAKAVSSAWSAIEGFFAGPVKWVNNNVLVPLGSAVDTVTSFLHLGAPFAGITKMAGGGRLPGYGGGDVVPALLEPGETVVDKARSRLLAPAFARAGVPGYQLGGIISGAGHIVSTVGHAAGDVLGALFGGLPLDLAKVGLDLAHGDTGGAERALLGLVPTDAGGASGGLAKILLALPVTLAKDAVNWALHPAEAFAKAGIAKSVTNTIASGVVGASSPGLYTIGRYLMAHGYTRAAAAGAAGVAGGESGGSPEAVGMGGAGLIGWTPPSAAFPIQPIVTGNVSRDMGVQLYDMISWMARNGWGPPQAAWANTAGGALAAAYSASATYERPLVAGSDVHPAMVADVWQHMAAGGIVGGGGSGAARPYGSYGALWAALAGPQAVVSMAAGSLARRAALALAGASKGSWLHKHRGTIGRELATLTRRQADEAAAFRLTGADIRAEMIREQHRRLGYKVGPDLAAPALRHLVTMADAESRAAMSALLHRAEPGMTAALAGDLADLGVIATSPALQLPGPAHGASLAFLLHRAGRRLLRADLATMRGANLRYPGTYGYAGGGTISEPVYGFGARSGAAYSFAEHGPETVSAHGASQTDLLLVQLLHELRRNTAAIQGQGSQFARGLNSQAFRGAQGGYFANRP